MLRTIEVSVYATDDSDREITLSCEVNPGSAAVFGGPNISPGEAPDVGLDGAVWTETKIDLTDAEDKLIPGDWQESAMEHWADSFE